LLGGGGAGLVVGASVQRHKRTAELRVAERQDRFGELTRVRLAHSAFKRGDGDRIKSKRDRGQLRSKTPAGDQVSQAARRRLGLAVWFDTERDCGQVDALEHPRHGVGCDG
jgi:hypothetical protein